MKFGLAYYTDEIDGREEMTMQTNSEYEARRVSGDVARQMLGDVDVRTLNRLVLSGRLPACRLTRKTLSIKVSDIEAFLAATRVRPAEAATA